MKGRDRHGRHQRADADLRHRPADGFRTATARRFMMLVQQAVALLAPEDRVLLQGGSVEVFDVPPPDAELDVVGDPPLAEVHLAKPGQPPRLVVYRRPLELRATRRAELSAEVERAVANALADALGRPREEEF